MPISPLLCFKQEGHPKIKANLRHLRPSEKKAKPSHKPGTVTYTVTYTSSPAPWEAEAELPEPSLGKAKHNTASLSSVALPKNLLTLFT